MLSPILAAITEAEQGTTGQIRVHLSQRWIEPNPYRRANTLFSCFGLSKNLHHNTILIYLNLKCRKFAILGDYKINHAVGSHFWKSIGEKLQENLRSTQSERAIALVIQDLGTTLRKHFPK